MTCIYSTQSVSMSASGFPFNASEKILCKGTCANGKPCRNKIPQSTSFPTRSSRSQQVSMLRFLTPQATNRSINRRSSFSVERVEFSINDDRNNYCYQHRWQAEGTECQTANAGNVRRDCLTDTSRHSQRPRTKVVHGLVSPISVDSDEAEDSDTETVDLTVSKNPFIIPHNSYDSPTSQTKKDVGDESFKTTLDDSPMGLPTFEFALLTCNDREASPSSPTRNVVHRSLPKIQKCGSDPIRSAASTTTTPLRPLGCLNLVNRTKNKLLKLIEMVHPVSEAHVAAAALNVIDILESIEIFLKKSSGKVDRSEVDIETAESRDVQLVSQLRTDIISINDDDEDLCRLLGSTLQFTTSDEDSGQTTPDFPPPNCNDSSFVRDIVKDIIQNAAGDPSARIANTVNSHIHPGTSLEPTGPCIAVKYTQNSIDSCTDRSTFRRPQQDCESNAGSDESFDDSTFLNQLSPAKVIESSSPTVDHSSDSLWDLLSRLSVTSTLEDEALTCENEASNASKYQCQGFSVSTGKRCKRNGRRLGSRSVEAVFCHQHKKDIDKEEPAVIVSRFGKYGAFSASFEPKFWLGSDLSPSTSHLLFRELREPISNSDSAGFIYGFEVENATGYVADTHALFKVGRTRDLSRRLVQWTKRCGYGLNLKYPDTSIFNGGYCKYVARAEKLIHLELTERHKVDRTVCKGCRSVHNEWFCARKGTGIGKQGIDEAWLQIEPVVIKWVNFIKVVYG